MSREYSVLEEVLLEEYEQIIINELKVGMMDGTAPHTRDPKADEQICRDECIITFSRSFN